MQTRGLRLEQAPPLAVPAGFFLGIPAAVLAAGALLLARGAAALSSPWAPETLALTHLGTLGVLMAAMWGAMVQLLPVVAGAPVPRVRWMHGAQAALGVGLGGLIIGFLWAEPWGGRVALAALGAALLLFLGPVGVALRRASGPVVPGMRLAALSLLGVALLGLWMAHGWSGGRFPGPRLPWIQTHLSLGLLGWAGGLVSAMSWQLLPLFWLAPPPPPAGARAVRLGLVVGVVGALLAHVAGAWMGAPGWAQGWLVPVAASPAVIAIWGLHPALAWRSIQRRKRSRPDASLDGWRLGLALGPVAGLCAIASVLGGGPALALAAGWLAIWGWAGGLVLATLTRIVPFLVWFHRFSALAALPDTPSARELLPEARVRALLGLHALGLALGLVAIASGLDPLARATGLALLVEGLALGLGLITLLRRRP